jgi:uncharacterized protein YlxW (UPF0749 family)
VSHLAFYRVLAMITLAVVVVAPSLSVSADALGAQPADASDIKPDEAEQARLQAEYARLKAEHDQLEARLASLEAEAAEERQRQLSLGPWEVLGLYWGALLLAVLWSWGWRGGRRS